ncbi:Phytoene desaturase (zeta-carotene-forming) protein [Dioscorea alata]|uniref:Phytoene desaturase (Zeta-carotene-forming) protein n=3 Tax=Dioscorea alata TaxID=55571 RepID=A0ACB7WNI2_DIOAL|nr:Phytoene desaturase (zeta-carotene-forming) protein [Dioscorea alata]KAH7690046.1 Phytoene desaturase (zeta-carotene-forming) protein [Dioscorea alata]KAH7690047.1 Phytoene desaturase (zeta-carotene-forming) protein [Dioscorea alata]
MLIINAAAAPPPPPPPTPPPRSFSGRHSRHCSSIALSPDADHPSEKKKVVVVGSGWAGLASAHHLTKQGFDVTVLGSGNGPAEEVGMRGFRYAYRNIFSLVDELGIKPFTNWTRSAHFSPDGLEVEFPIFQDLPKLPAPFGALLYPQFLRLPLVDRLTSIPLMAAVIDFDNTDIAWRKYDAMTARELFKQFGCSERLCREAFEPFLQIGLFAPGEQCSAAATLGMLYYFFLAHQQNFDVLWCRGSVQDKIFTPWLESMKIYGCKFHGNSKVTDFILDGNNGTIAEVVCGQEAFQADAVVLAEGVSAVQSTVSSSPVLQSSEEFLQVLNLSSIDFISLKLWLDRKVQILKPGNVCFGVDGLSGWTFFDLNSIYDEYEDEPATVLQADFAYARQLLPLKDDQIVQKVVSCLSICIKGLNEATVLQHIVDRFPNSATHFFPGSYKYMMRGSSSFPNLFMAGDWIVTRHGSWSQEKAYVTGLEAANRVVDYFGDGSLAKIIAVEEDEPHIETLRSINRRLAELRAELPLSDFFLQ